MSIGWRSTPSSHVASPPSKGAENLKMIDNVQSNAAIQPEWLRIKEAVRFSGLGRSTLYGFIADGTLKSVCVRKRGNIRGIRLIAVGELRRFIEAQIERPLGNQVQ
jgi:hypothetical protein